MTQDIPIIHHVFFWLKNPGSEADRRELIAGLETLRAIDRIKFFHIGVPAPTEDREVIDNSYAVSELMFFDRLEDEAYYQSHPIHLAFISACNHLWSRVLVYDTVDA